MPWIDLADAKAHLNKTSGADDAELQGFIEAACAMVEDLIGHVDTASVSEVVAARPVLVEHPFWRYNTWQQVATLSEGPVLSVTSVSYLAGDGTSTAVVPIDLAAGVTQGWRRVDRVLYVPLGTHSVGGYSVAYTVGLNPVPGNVRMAALELVGHLWRTTQRASASPGRAASDDTSFERGLGFAMPFRVRELLGLYGQQLDSTGFIVA